MNISQYLVVGLLIACLIYFVMRFLIMIFGMSWAVAKGNKEAKAARIKRQMELKEMSTDRLRILLKSDSYLNGLRGSQSLKDFFEKLEQEHEKEIIKNTNEKTLYHALAKAEYEKGHKDRPEAIDNISEIWDALKELGGR